MRRGGRGGTGDSSSLMSQFLSGAFTTGDVAFDADYHALDPDTKNVTSWIDYLDPTHALSQSAGGTAQVLTPVADPAYGDRLVGRFTGTQRYDSNRPASAFPFHYGSGCTIYAGFKRTGAGGTVPSVLSTQTGNDGGLFMRWFGGSPSNLQVGVIAGPSGTFVINTTANGVLAQDVGTYVSFSYKEGITPEFELRSKSTLSTSGLSATAPFAAPGSTLSLGNAPGSFSTVTGAVMNWRFLYIHFRMFTAADHTYEQEAIRALHSVQP